MDKIKETIELLKELISSFGEGLKNDITSISHKTKIILCSLGVFGIISVIYPPIFIFVIATIIWLMVTSVPIILIGSCIIMFSIYLIVTLTDSKKPYLGALISSIITLLLVCCGIYCIYNWVLVEAIDVYTSILSDIF